MEKPKLGLLSIKNRSSNVKSLANIKLAKNPVLSDYARGGLYRGLYTPKSPFDFTAINNAYQVDPLFRQGVDKYIEVITKEGWYFSGKDKVVNYIKDRINILTLSTGIPWDLFILNITKDIVLFGNSVLVVSRGKIPIRTLGASGKLPINGYFQLPIPNTLPQVNESGNLAGWVQCVNGIKKEFPLKDTLHLAYYREPGNFWGVSDKIGVIDDIRCLRQIEETIQRLLYKNTNPIIQHITPDITGTGEGRPEDVTDAVNAWANASADSGIFITPPGTEIKIHGMESQALRAEGYLNYFKKRVFAGLGVSELVMGENTQAAGTVPDSILSQMHQKAKIYQLVLSNFITLNIINEMLIEGGYNPWANEDDKVSLIFNEIEIDRRIKEETHALALWTMNLIGSEEARERIQLHTKMDWKDSYMHQTKIPEILASKLAYDPLTESKPKIDNDINTKDKTSNRKVSKTPSLKNGAEHIDKFIERSLYFSKDILTMSQEDFSEKILTELKTDTHLCEEIYNLLTNSIINTNVNTNIMIQTIFNSLRPVDRAT